MNGSNYAVQYALARSEEINDRRLFGHANDGYALLQIH